MIAISKSKLKIKPYARLLTMLGDQLIKDEKIALIELIKNSYDADASWVQVRFVNFKKVSDNKYEYDKDSYIEIEDDGDGMSEAVIKNAWMNPATPIKLLQKKRDVKKTKRKKRVMQGEKGIGRFALFKLGSTINLTTRPIEGKANEYILRGDFSEYDEEFLTKKNKKQDIFLKDLHFDFEINETPQHIIDKDIIIQGVKRKRPCHGTIIKISNLKGNWTKRKIEDIYLDAQKLLPLFGEESIQEEFAIELLFNGQVVLKEMDNKSTLNDLLFNAPVVIEDGYYNDKNQKITFKVNKREKSIKLSECRAQKEFKERFCDTKTGEIVHFPRCGPFKFAFYIFDFTPKAPPKFKLEMVEKKTIKDNRIYLYRDGVRVYPYGNLDDDWIRVDVLRGTGRAGDYLSNDQMVGYVSITQKHNPNLKDKTNREGLIDIDGAFGDFRALIQTILGIARTEYKKYQIDQEEKEKQKIISGNSVEEKLDWISKYLDDKNEKKGARETVFVKNTYLKEKRILEDKAEKIEDLAGVGLAVEITSHDIMLMIGRAKDTIDFLLKTCQTKTIEPDILNENLQKLRGQISFAEDQLKGIQPIFRSSRRRSKNHRITQVVANVRKYFDILLNKYNIKVEIESLGPPLVVKAPEAVLLQTLINLLDNSIYWLQENDLSKRNIKILINGNSYEIIFSDNGPGINDDDIPYIFNAFFSTKGLKGRGLGLYIARQLLERHDFQINYITDSKKKLYQKGANFEIKF